MDIQIRKQLEQLEYIKDKLEYIEYSESLQCYVEKLNGIPTGVAAWVNGAFYGFEQAAKAQAQADTKRIDFLADKSQSVANVMLPTKIVERNLSSLRDAIDQAMMIEEMSQ